ncbi:UNVERIFIED_CONTAM: hypothetical protein HDU68_001238, partial [Siphonaria sp. JEL0065]
LDILLRKASLDGSQQSSIPLESLTEESECIPRSTESSENTRDDLFYTTTKNEHLPPIGHHLDLNQLRDVNAKDAQNNNLSVNTTPPSALPVTNLEDLESHSILPISATTDGADVYSESSKAESLQHTSSAGASLSLDSAETSSVLSYQATKPLLDSVIPLSSDHYSDNAALPSKVSDRLKQLEQKSSISPSFKKTAAFPQAPSKQPFASSSIYTPTSSTTPRKSPSTEFPSAAASSPVLMKRTPSVQKRVYRTTASLLLVKGKRKFHVTQCPVSPASLTHNDVYILEVPLPTPKTSLKSTGEIEEIRATLFLWCGMGSGKVKRAKGKEVAYRIRERDWGTKAEIVEVCELAGLLAKPDRSFVDEERELRFWRSLTGNGAAVVNRDLEYNCKVAADDADYEKIIDAKLSLYGLDEDDQFSVVASNGHNLSVKLINSSSCFILECKDESVYVWTGRGSTKECREAALEFATNLSKASSSPLHEERDLSESVLFMEKFQDWTDHVSIQVKQPKNIAPKDKTRAAFDRGAYKPPATQISVVEMFSPPTRLASWDRQADGSTQVVDIGGPPPVELDRGKLELRVWIAVGSELVDIPKEEQGLFYSGECYLLHYKHLMGRDGNEKDVGVAYFWIGDNSKMTEQGTIAYAAIDLEKKHNARQIRVSQGHEPEHFLSIFGPTKSEKLKATLQSIATLPPIVIRRGNRSLATNAIEKTLFNISGYSPQDIRAVQVAWNIANFNSAVVFLAIMEDGSGVLWVGDGAHGFEREAGINAGQRLCKGRRVKEVQELCEPAGFWQQFGLESNQSPRGLYASVPYLLQKAKFTADFKRRLWKVSHVVNGGATAELITPFTQKDLDETGIYILDAFFEVFVWVGRKAHGSHKDIRLALTTSVEYAKYAEKQQPVRLEYEKKRDELRVWMIRDGQETLEFKSCFASFDDGVKDLGSTTSFRFFNSLLESSNNRYAGQPKIEHVKGLLDKIEKGIYSAEELRNKENLPIGVDPSNVERHLSADDFKKLFKTDIATYEAYPAWKRLDLKKKAGLF